jgi:hypothetical protein
MGKLLRSGRTPYDSATGDEFAGTPRSVTNVMGEARE